MRSVGPVAELGSLDACANTLLTARVQLWQHAARVEVDVEAAFCTFRPCCYGGGFLFWPSLTLTISIGLSDT